MSAAPPNPSATESAGCFQLDGLQVDPTTGEIEGPGGREQVDPRVMAVLVALARRPHELVTRTELLEGIWPGGTIYDDTLTQCVYQLRQHLVAAGGADRYRKLVKTLPKRGYLLDSDLTPLELSAHGSPTATPAWYRSPAALVAVAALVMLAAAAFWMAQRRAAPALAEQQTILPPNAIAVLPFVNVSGQAGDDYLSEGLADDLRDRVAALRELRVVARRSSAHFRDQDIDTTTIGRELGVGRVVEGRFIRSGERVTVAVELVDTASGFRLWSQRYERPAQDFGLIQRALLSDLIRQLSPWRTQPSQSAPESFEQLAAHDLLLLGRQYERQITDEQVVDEALLERTIELYGQAVEIDPRSAEAQARLGSMLLYRGDVTAAEPHILAAVQLDPERGDTFTTLGLYYWAVRQDGSGAAYRRAIELNPSDADALSYYAGWAWLQGDAEEAVVYYRAALLVDPLTLIRHADLGYKLAFQGSRAEAQAVLDRMLELFQTAPAYLAATRIAEALGELDEAIAWALKAQQLRPDDADISGQVAELLARVGAFEEAAWFEPEPSLGQLFWQRRYGELVDQGEELLIDRPGDAELAYLVAFAYGALGRYESAVRLLEAAGLPGTVLAESRRAGDLHALHFYIGSLLQAGRAEEAQQLAAWSLAFNNRLLPTEGRQGWLPHLAEACALAVLDEPERALAALEHMAGLGTLPRLPWLLDMSCLASLQSDSRYRAVIDREEARLAEIRRRIPQTLERHGVRAVPVGEARLD